jgi:hypothetical protein
MIPSGIVDRGKILRLVIEILRDRKEHLWPMSKGEAKVDAGALKPLHFPTPRSARASL